MKRDWLKVRTWDGQGKTVVADIDGPVAVHPTLKGEGYTVTHVKSGFAIVTHVTEPQAVKVASLCARLPITWDLDREFKFRSREEKLKVKAVVLSVVPDYKKRSHFQAEEQVRCREASGVAVQ